jgi:DNA (cytosine-5)-methyltransferase 1
MCLTTKTRIDAETETLIPMHGGGFDVETLHGEDIARTLSARHDGSPCDDRGPNVVAYRTTGNAGCYVTGDKVDALTTGTDPNSHVVAFGMDNGAAHCLRSGASKADKPDSTTYVGTHSAVRRLTPRECERLQGFPDDYTAVPYRGKPASDGPRYKALGNSMAVPVMSWIGQRIQQVERILSEQEQAA